jgi:GAF domain-containing protein/HAMP domain-containing protein
MAMQRTEDKMLERHNAEAGESLPPAARRRRFSLRAKVVFFAVVLSLGPLLLVSLALLGIGYNAQQSDLFERQQDTSQQMAAQVQSTMLEIQQALDIVAKTSNWQSLDPTEQRILIDTLYAYRTLAQSRSGFGAFDEVLLLDDEGQPVAGHSSIRLTSLESWAAEVRAAAFDTVMQGRVYVGPVFWSQAVAPTVNVAVPARDLPGRVTGMLWGGINLEKALRPIVTAPGLPEDSLVYLFDGQGNLILRNDQSVAQRDESLRGLFPVRQAAGKEAQGVDTYEGLMGERVVGAWQAVEGIDCTVVVELPADLVVASIRRLLMPSALLSVAAIAVAAVAGVMVSRRLTGPIEHLRAGAEVVGAGDLSHRIEVPYDDEIGDLARAFNQMAANLKTSRTEIESWSRELERKVQERTSELERLVLNMEETTEQSSRRALRLDAAAQVSRAIAAMLDPEQLLEQVVDLIADRLGFYHVGVFMLDETGQYARLRAANSAGGQRMLAQGHRLRVGEQGIVGYVTDVGRPRIALDVGADAVHFVNPELPNTRSEMALPMMARGRILGALDVQSVEPAAFGDEDVAVLQTLADQIGIALDNARLFEETQAALEQVRAVQAQYIRQSWQTLGAELEIRDLTYTPAGVGAPDEEPLPGIEQVVRTGEALVTEAGNGGGASFLLLPVKLHGQVIGVLGLQGAAPDHVWLEDEIALAETVVDRMAQAMESARLFREARQRAWRERTARQIAGQIRASADVHDIMQTTAQELGRVLGVSRAIVRLQSPQASEEASS